VLGVGAAILAHCTISSQIVAVHIVTIFANTVSRSGQPRVQSGS
jgi:hypothetical protein